MCVCVCVCIHFICLSITQSNSICMAFCQFENFMTSANRGSSFLFFLFLVILSKASKEHASFKFQIDLSIILPSHIFVLKNTHKKKLKKSLSSTSGLRGHLLLAFLNEKKPFNQNFHFVNKMSKKKKKKTVSRSLGYVSPIIRSLKMAPPRWEFLMYFVQSRNQNRL